MGELDQMMHDYKKESEEKIRLERELVSCQRELMDLKGTTTPYGEPVSPDRS